MLGNTFRARIVNTKGQSKQAVPKKSVRLIHRTNPIFYRMLEAIVLLASFSEAIILCHILIAVLYAWDAVENKF